MRPCCRYTQAAVEWAAWVNTVPSERYDFYKDTVHDWDKRASVEVELQKINCFNCILDCHVFVGTGVSPSAVINSAFENFLKRSVEFHFSVRFVFLDTSLQTS